MTHDFFLNLTSVFFPLLCLILTFVPSDFNHYINVIVRWFYRRFSTSEGPKSELELNTTALRFFGIIGLTFSLAMIALMFYKPTA